MFGKDNTVNCYLDIEFGAATIVADWVYVCDFDHVYSDIHVPIKDQGIVKTPVRIGPDCWVGTKVTVLRGITVGRGCVLAAHAVVNKDVPDHSVVVGVPGRVVKNRVEEYERAAGERAGVADMARKQRERHVPRRDAGRTPLPVRVGSPHERQPSKDTAAISRSPCCGQHGVEEMFTLSGGHVFPLYDAAHTTGVRIVDVRHEQTAVFAAEGVAKLTGRPGAGRADRRSGRHQRRLRRDHRALQRRRRWSCSAAGRRSGAGAPARCRSSTTSRCWRRSPSTRPP